MKKIILVFVLLSSIVFAQSPQKYLKQNYIDSYIKNYAEIETLVGGSGVDLSEEYDLVSIKEAFKKLPTYETIMSGLSEYGLGENPIDAYLAIGFGYVVVSFEDYAKTVKDAEAKKQIKLVLDEYKKYVHKDDIKLISKNKKKIDEYLSAMEQPQ